MPTIMTSIEGASVKRFSGKPKKLVRGLRRKCLQKLAAQLQVLVSQEGNEGRRAAQNNYTPFLVLGAQNSKWAKAFTELQSRINESLRAQA